MRLALSAGAAAAALSFPAASARAAEPPAERQLTPEEVQAWLDRPGTAPPPDTLTPGSDEAPPPPPRKHGVTVESSIGALSHLGTLKNVTPTSPWFHLKVGFEPLSWLMLFAETDLTISNTGYASPPPPPRTYHLYGFGGGLRFTVPFSERFGGYLEGSGGVSAASSDVLEVYGYSDATELKPYFGGRLGADWYPLNPHMAVSLHGGVRSFRSLIRERSDDNRALAILGGLALRYTF
jgi:hypothetical protein